MDNVRTTCRKYYQVVFAKFRPLSISFYSCHVPDTNKLFCCEIHSVIVIIVL